MLQVKAIKTEVFKLGDDLINFICLNLKGENLEGRVLAVTSKIVSLSENRLVNSRGLSKENLVKKEADHYIGKTFFDCHLTIKEGLLIPSAGIDESNSENNDYILYPESPFVSARNIHQGLKKALNLKNFGVLLTDSTTTPLRRGVTGVALSYYGFKGVESQIGEKDLFGRELQMTHINVADALAVSATLVMGEGGQSCPLAIITHKVKFMELDDNAELQINPAEDLYWPVLMKNLSKN